MDTAAVPERRGSAAGVPERLLVALLSLGVVAALHVLRGADDNRLTSWRWIFDAIHPLALYAAVAAGLVLAQVAASLPLPARRADAVLFLSAYAAGACTWGVPEVIVDAARYFTQAKHLELYGAARFLAGWGTAIPAWTDLPLVPFLDGLVLRLSGESRTAVQAFTTLLFAGSAVLTSRVGKALWDEEAGFLAGALLLAIPYLLSQVPAFLVDVPTMFFLVLALYATIEACRGGGAGRILLASTAVLLAFLSKYSAWLLLSVLPVAVVTLPRDRGRPLRAGAAIALCSGALLAAALLAKRGVVTEQLALLFGYQAPGLRRWGESFASTFLFQVHPFVTAAALAALAVAVRRRDARLLAAAWPVLLLVGLGVHRIRYLLPAFPMLALMAAYGLRALPAPGVRRLVAASAVASSLAVAFTGHVPFLRATSPVNLARAGAWLDGLPGGRARVFTVQAPGSEVNQEVSVPILDLFTRKRLVHVQAPAAPPAALRVEESALRFTWELRTPPYYGDDGGAEDAVVVISGERAAPLPDDLSRTLRGWRLARSFDASDDVFRHATYVDVYLPARK
jgi:hypothetical protein